MQEALRSATHLWQCNRSYWQELANDNTMLSEDEISKFNSYKIKDDRLRFAVGRVMLRTIAADYTGVAARDINIGVNKHGKPFLAGNCELHFNISHSGDWVIVGFSMSPIGVDVQQQMLKKIDYNNVAKHAFHLDEIDFINDNEENKGQVFYKIWCIKEALSKAKGQGFYDDIAQYSVVPIVNQQTTMICGYNIHDLTIDQNHYAAVAIYNSCDEVVRHNFMEQL